MKKCVYITLGALFLCLFSSLIRAQEISANQGQSLLFGNTFSVDNEEKGDSPLKFSGNMVGIWQDGEVRYPGDFRLSQVWLTAEKELDTENKNWDLGFRVDALFGTKVLSCVADGGFDAKWGMSSDGYGTSIRQAFLKAGNGKLALIGGKFASALGYESADDSERDFNTNTAMYLHEAGTNCGAGFEWTPNEKFLFDFFGVTGNETSFEDPYGDYGYVFYLLWKPNDKFWFSYASELNRIHSQPGEDRTLMSGDYYMALMGRSVADHNEYYSTTVVSYNLTEKWNAACVFDHATMADTKEKLARFGHIGVSPYLTYHINERWTAALRYEYYTVWLKEAGKCEGCLNSAREHDLSYGMVYRPVPTLFLRPEIRYDWTKYEEEEEGVTGSVGVGWIF